MTQRKSWTQMEDKILKMLRQKCGDKKWSEIAELMKAQYGIQGRNGKQCRERYHNHLDQRISKSIWKSEEDQLLLSLHNKFGNRWAHIARVIQGRTDNCVKNRFYSKFRRSIRVINQMIKIFWKKEFKPLKIAFITKIIEITEQQRESGSENKKEVFQTCQDLKCRLMSFSDCNEQILRSNQHLLALLYNLIKDINFFNKKNKRRGKKKRRECSDEEGEENFQFATKNDVKMACQNIKGEMKKKKQNPIIKIEQISESVPVKTEQQYFIKQELEQLQKIIQNKNPCQGGQIFTNTNTEKLSSPILLLNQGNRNFFSLYEINDEHAEQGFDINEFYSLENLYERQNPTYY